MLRTACLKKLKEPYFSTELRFRLTLPLNFPLYKASFRKGLLVKSYKFIKFYRLLGSLAAGYNCWQDEQQITEKMEVTNFPPGQQFYLSEVTTFLYKKQNKYFI